MSSTSVVGTKRTSSDVRVESAIGREADNLSKAGRAQEKVTCQIWTTADDPIHAEPKIAIFCLTSRTLMHAKTLPPWLSAVVKLSP